MTLRAWLRGISKDLIVDVSVSHFCQMILHLTTWTKNAAKMLKNYDLLKKCLNCGGFLFSGSAGWCFSPCFSHPMFPWSVTKPRPPGSRRAVAPQPGAWRCEAFENPWAWNPETGLKHDLPLSYIYIYSWTYIYIYIHVYIYINYKTYLSIYLSIDLSINQFII